MAKQTTAAPSPNTAAEWALIRNKHSIGGDCPGDADSRLSMASDRIKFIGFALEAISNSEGDLGPLDAESMRAVGMMLQELGEDVHLALNLVILQSNERTMAKGGH